MASFNQFGNDLHTGKLSFNIVGRRKLWYSIAGVMILIAVLVPILRGGFTFGIEFTGGSQFVLSEVSTEEQDLTAQRNGLARVAALPGQTAAKSIKDADGRVAASRHVRAPYASTPPHTLHPGSRLTLSSRKRVLIASINNKRPTSGSPKPASNFRASSACKLPTNPTSGPITPASLHVSSVSLPCPYRQW